MKENTSRKPARIRAVRPRTLVKRRQIDAPDFLVRLTGKARAKSLSKDVIIIHRHD